MLQLTYLTRPSACKVAILTWLITFAGGAVAAGDRRPPLPNSDAQRVPVYVGICSFRLFNPGGCTLSDSAKDLCSVTLQETAFRLQGNEERPGDAMISLVDRFSKRAAGYRVCGKDGSGVRFAGTVTLVIESRQRGYGDFVVKVRADPSAPRLSFKKTPKGWVYLAGTGIVELTSGDGRQSVTRLGHWRTVESCLATLASSDEILREGCARDLGRLATEKDSSTVVPALSRLLKDSVADVRSGAAEGLGRLAVKEATDSLLAAATAETDPLVKSHISEALALSAGMFLLGHSDDVGLPREEAARIYNESASRWIGTVIAVRQPGAELHAARIEKLLAAAAPEERLAGVRLALSVVGPSMIPSLSRVAQDDPDSKVKDAAKMAAQELRSVASER